MGSSSSTGVVWASGRRPSRRKTRRAGATFAAWRILDLFFAFVCLLLARLVYKAFARIYKSVYKAPRPGSRRSRSIRRALIRGHVTALRSWRRDRAPDQRSGSTDQRNGEQGPINADRSRSRAASRRPSATTLPPPAVAQCQRPSAARVSIQTRGRVILTGLGVHHGVLPAGLPRGQSKPYVNSVGC